MTDKQMNIIDACRDSDLFAPWFERGDWSAWFAFLAALFALPMTDKQKAIYRKHTRRTQTPVEAFAEAWLVVGRRGGKSFIVALVAVWLACFRDYRKHLQPGERGTVLVIAADRKQARVIMRYVKGLLENVAMLRPLVVRETTEEIELSNGVSIEIGTASFRSTRGYTVVAALLDEIAFWRNDESANPDDEVLNAIAPGMATIPNSMMLALSSPYAKRGVLWQAYKQHFGKDSGTLVWQAETRVMNPSVPQAIIDRALQKDSPKARAEYLALFRADLESYIAREVVEQATRSSPLQLPFDKGNEYQAFVDPAGGGHDEFCMAIGHSHENKVIADCVMARRGVPASIVVEYAEILKGYGIRKVTGDRYAGSWPADEFSKHGIQYWPADKNKSQLYLELLPALNSGTVEIPPDERLFNQIIGLERRTSRTGRDQIDHPPGASDDRANVIAGLVAITGKPRQAGALFGTYGSAQDDCRRGYYMTESTGSRLAGKQGN